MKLRPRSNLLNICRLNHSSMVSSSDLFLENQNLGLPARARLKDHDFHFYPRSTTNFESMYIDGSGAHRNSNLVEQLDRDSQLQKLLESRTVHIQRFLGPSYSLSFDDMLLILCGLANLKLKQVSNPTGSVFDRGLIHQDVLRESGKRYFRSTLLSSTIFQDNTYLSTSHSEVQHNLAFFGNQNQLIINFMKRQLLYDCLVPHRGAQVDGTLSRDKANLLRQKIRDNTAIGSFYSMLGILLFRYGNEDIATNLLQDKILGGTNGIYSIARS
ncbi:hypothetical protein FT663_01502 [Candidozyma haemuli var. vulneris]|nr:hypothetical protein FT662_02454 [[Candida] haemuloni var. vulneris]KAF3994382.1 hypothetical protein FT663_01502 [[Candida] haemuloni var. vulneris]